jgi:hypothetical protein
MPAPDTCQSGSAQRSRGSETPTVMKELTDLFATDVGQLGLAGGQLIGNGGCGLPVRTLHHQLPVLGNHSFTPLIHGLFQSICWQPLEKSSSVFSTALTTVQSSSPMSHVFGYNSTVQYSTWCMRDERKKGPGELALKTLCVVDSGSKHTQMPSFPRKLIAREQSDRYSLFQGCESG